MLDDEEAVALAVGLMAAAQSSVAGTAESSMRALAKVVQVMPARLRRQAEALQAMVEPAPGGAMPSSVDPQALTAIAQACRDRSGCVSTTCRPEVSRARATSSRTAWSPSGDAGIWSATTSIAMTGARFASIGSAAWSAPEPASPRALLPAADAATFVRESLRRCRRSYTVEALIAADADAVRDRVGPWASVEPALAATA